jgi:hypothetical protein
VAVVLLIAVCVLAAHQPTARAEQPPKNDEDYAERVTDRLMSRLGASNRGADPRVRVLADPTAMCVLWALNQPDTTREVVNARAAMLRRELRRVLRALAAVSPPEAATDIVVQATFPDAAETDTGPSQHAEVTVLDARLSAATVTDLEADDVRLDDATLGELLGLARVVTGDPRWGVPAPPPTADTPSQQSSSQCSALPGHRVAARR